MTYQTTVVGAVVALVLLVVATVIALSLSGNLNAESTPVLVTIIGFVAPTIVSLLALLRGDRAVAVAHKINGDVADLNRRMEVSDPGGSKFPAGEMSARSQDDARRDRGV